MSALDTQVGGAHYKELAIQPVEYIHKNNIPFIEGSVIKYVTRWRSKGGVDDLRKAKHFLDLLIEMETGASAAPEAQPKAKTVREALIEARVPADEQGVFVKEGA
jgi:hypothetical protein